MHSTNGQRRRLSRSILTLLFILAGILHFVFPAKYAEIMPPFLPYPLALVFISGVAEVMGGVGALIPTTRRASGYGLIALLIAVFPANINMLVQQMAHGWSVATLVLVLRLPLQFLLIWWVYQVTCAEPPIPIAKRPETVV